MGRLGRLLRKGIPWGRFLPFALGMYTRRAGFALGIFQLLASFTRCAGVSTTSLSTPAGRLGRDAYAGRLGRLLTQS